MDPQYSPWARGAHMALPSEAIASAAYILIDNLLGDYLQPRRWWRHILYKERSGSTLLSDLKFQKISGHYKNFTRTDPTDFEWLMNSIGPKIKRKDTYCREAISVQDRLAITLRYLATGDSYTSLQYLFRISKQLISRLIPEVCRAIVDALKQTVKMPQNKNDWQKVNTQFNHLWQYPHELGAMDGKHIIIQCPFNSRSEYFYYKSHFSIVLLAIVDAEYNFLYTHIGTQGRISDGGAFKGCNLNEMIETKILDIPEPEALPNRNKPISYFFLADSAFALSENIMKPYSGIHSRGSKERIFNYRLSRVRRVVENAFGIMARVFRVLRKPMLLQPPTVEIVTMAIIYLHSFLRRGSSNSYYTPPGVFDTENNETGEVTPGYWRNDQNLSTFLPLPLTPRRSAAVFKQYRDELADYFLNEGKVEWQTRYA